MHHILTGHVQHEIFGHRPGHNLTVLGACLYPTDEDTWRSRLHMAPQTQRQSGVVSADVLEGHSLLVVFLRLADTDHSNLHRIRHLGSGRRLDAIQGTKRDPGPGERLLYRQHVGTNTDREILATNLDDLRRPDRQIRSRRRQQYPIRRRVGFRRGRRPTTITRPGHTDSAGRRTECSSETGTREGKGDGALEAVPQTDQRNNQQQPHPQRHRRAVPSTNLERQTGQSTKGGLLRRPQSEQPAAKATGKLMPTLTSAIRAAQCPAPGQPHERVLRSANHLHVIASLDNSTRRDRATTPHRSGFGIHRR